MSLVGAWTQGVAQSWLVLQLTHSATLLGFVVAVQFVPVLLGGPYGGLIADRTDKRRLLPATQSTCHARHRSLVAAPGREGVGKVGVGDRNPGLSLVADAHTTDLIHDERTS